MCVCVYKVCDLRVGVGRRLRGALDVRALSAARRSLTKRSESKCAADGLRASSSPVVHVRTSQSLGCTSRRSSNSDQRINRFDREYPLARFRGTSSFRDKSRCCVFEFLCSHSRLFAELTPEVRD